MNEMQRQLDHYYRRVGIAPVEDRRGNYDEMFSVFCCPKKEDCRKVCCEEHKSLDRGEEFIFSPRTDGVEISRCYKNKTYLDYSIPRIVVVSLSAPMPGPPLPSAEKKRTPLNQHWRETLAMVRSLLHSFIAPEKFPEPVAYEEDESKKIVEQLFVHVRTAKCCSNANGKKREPGQVYKNCGCYLSEELGILEPNVIVTQGDPAHDESKNHVFGEGAMDTEVEEVRGVTNSIARIVNLKEDNGRVCWLRTYHPSYYKCFYCQAGPRIDSEIHVVGAMRENFVCYGKHIHKLMKDGIL